MRARKGPRPWSIRAFAVLFSCAAILGFVDGLAGLDDPGLQGASRDAAIIGSSARLTIAFMTTGLVWFFAFRLARWFVPLFLLGKVFAALAMVWRSGTAEFVSMPWVAAMALGLVAALLLVVPSAGPWFLPRSEVDPAAVD